MAVITYKCPNCGGGLVFDPKSAFIPIAAFGPAPPAPIPKPPWPPCIRPICICCRFDSDAAPIKPPPIFIPAPMPINPAIAPPFVASKGRELGKYMSDTLDEDWKTMRGMEIQSVGIASISYDEESQKLINMRNQGAMLSDPSVREGYVQGAIARGMAVTFME